MQKILFIFGNPAGATGLCCKAVAQELKRSGFYVCCLVDRGHGAKQTYYEEGLTYYTVRPHWFYRFSSWSRTVNMKKPHNMFFSRLCHFFYKVQLAIFSPIWPLNSLLHAYRVCRAASKIVRENQIDTIIASYNPLNALIAGALIKKKHPNIRYIPYFLDSLSGAFGPRCFSKKWTINRGIKWEKKLLPPADRIVVMQSSRVHHETYNTAQPYYKKFQYLDIPMLKPAAEQGVCEFLPKNKTNILFIGNLQKGVRDAAYFIKTFSLIDNEDLRLTIVGSSNYYDVLEKAAENDPRIQLRGYVDHATALSAEQTADILVNIGNKNVSMVPSKIFEYMSAGKPIVSTAPIEDEPSIPYLEKYPCALILYENANPQENAKRLAEFIAQCKTAQVDIAALYDSFFLNTPQAFVDCITACDA